MERSLHHLSHASQMPSSTPTTGRGAGPKDKNKLVQFLDVQLRKDATHSVKEEYPALFGEYPGGESLYIETGGEIAAHVGFVAREFQHSAFRMKVGLIGSVVTAPQFRRQGMGSALVSTAVAHLRRKGCTLALLWGDSPAFYEPLGFYRAGREVQLKFSADQVPPMQQKVIEFSGREHAGAIWRLYQQHDVKLDRSLEEQRKLCSIPNLRVFLTEQEGHFTSYVAINKGADFTHFIHEWAGDPTALQENIATVQRTYYPSQSLTLIAPAHYDLGSVKQIASEKRDGVLGLMKVVDREALVFAYLKFLTSLGLKHRWDKANQLLHCEGSVYSLGSDQDYLEIILGGTLAGLPALPFFLWGFDSI